VYAPDWNTRFCEIPEQARATRRHVLEYCAEHDTRLFPTHFAAPHVARIIAKPEGFSVEFVPRDRTIRDRHENDSRGTTFAAPSRRGLLNMSRKRRRVITS
jgi:hypothetical protein